MEHAVGHRSVTGLAELVGVGDEDEDVLGHLPLHPVDVHHGGLEDGDQLAPVLQDLRLPEVGRRPAGDQDLTLHLVHRRHGDQHHLLLLLVLGHPEFRREGAVDAVAPQLLREVEGEDVLSVRQEELEVGPHFFVQRRLHEREPAAVGVPAEQVEVEDEAVDLLAPLVLLLLGSFLFHGSASLAAAALGVGLVVGLGVVFVVVDERLVLELVLRLLAFEPVKRLEPF